MSLETEKKTIAAMIRIYCKDLHKTEEGLCSKCSDLLDYASKRIDHCPFKVNKPACNTCTVHCYAKDKRARVKQVMRYSGPRMPLRHPYLSVMHLMSTWKNKKKKVRN